MDEATSQWEVVTKSKKQRNLEKKVEQQLQQKRKAEITPQLEEILPSQKYRKMTTSNANNAAKLFTKPSPTKSTGSEKSKLTSETAKKPQENKKPQSITKPTTKPKSIEMALQSITPTDFENQLQILKHTYPGSELLWLRGAGLYLNSSLPYNADPIFSGKSINYPMNLATKELKQTMLDFLDSMGVANLTYFYHRLLESMCMDLAKNAPVIGYKLLLQLIGRNWPKICSNDMAKTALLRNSYQNRSNIGLSLFWAIGQGGYEELMEGLKVWQNLMLWNLELRSYSKFVVEYLEKILTTSIVQSLTMDQQTFFDLYNILRSSYKNVAKDCQQSLRRSSDLFLQKYIACSTKHANIFLQLFRDIKHSDTDAIELDGCISCLLKNNDSFKVWKMNFKKQIGPSTMLLEKIVSEWENIGSALMRSRFEDFLRDAAVLISELKNSKKKIDNLDLLVDSVKSAQQTAASHKKKQSNSEEKKCGCCKWVLGSIFLIALIGGALTYDTNVNGRGVFAASATGKALKNAGLLPHVEKAWYVTMSASARGYKWAEVNVPPYAKPAGKLACDLYKTGRNAACNAFGLLRDFVASKLPVVAEFLEQYIPGLPKAIENGWVAVKGATIRAADATTEFFKTQVFVGRLSPENIRKAVNETQNAAWEYYYVFHKKVDAYAKLK